MKILMVNKFLYPNGGSETYIFKLGKQLERLGHEVQYFGMSDPRNIVGNRAGAYTSNKEFRSGVTLDKLCYPFEIIYSSQARKQIRRVLLDFRPDVVHLNNINFQITPSILWEIRKNGIPMVWTAHDYQLVCPNHMLYDMKNRQICERCLSGGFGNCLKHRCLHGSAAKSALAMLEAQFYRAVGVYGKVNAIICPSMFLREKLETRHQLRGKCVVMHNFVDEIAPSPSSAGSYVLYFGRFDSEKGIRTLIQAAKALPHIPFVFAGGGELEGELAEAENIRNAGFQSGSALESLIRGAAMTVYPSEWYENCPFSVIESQAYGVPVVGANIGGIPELIENGKTGLLFASGSCADLQEKISLLWNDRALAEEMRKNCRHLHFDTITQYCQRLIELYQTP